ncbi:hypothetical protein MNEG_4307 [Monoraphidium neglectum]|uniref:Uncharacterized protein n=1 Tax=Monoraphidium neglectum TaxID=145388 RepID=A0A0D2JYS1_9CHLO|nr:hypothetical protein MNEG_4307 [Monoraphidium neglectum]KIZ03653.1 hypothetical protein MNEG_4307 [Monoraphidium neglectum]|eukprot:XP_013902672.1 hypothetical protein MNEG_4307 [Monoraphidium neglectum]
MDGSGMCYTAKSLCPPGSQPLDGQCCAEEPRNVCWAALGACPGGCTSMEPICSPSKPYSDVIAHVSVEAVSNPSPKEAAAGVAFFKLGLPKLDLVKNVLIAGKGIAKAIEEKVVSVPLTVLAKTKEILGKGKGATGGVVVKAEAYAKAGVVPKCFQKCVPDLVCVAPKIDKAVVAPSLTCPPGCSPADGDKCLCAPGGPCPCPPGTKECPFAGGRMCVSLDLCFGLDQCKMMSLLAPHLPILSCPTPLGGGRAALASAFASASAAGN